MRTAELAWFTVSSKEQRHYLLANIALVGEAITLANGEFSNIMHNQVPIMVDLKSHRKARWFRLTPLAEIEGRSVTSIGEIGKIPYRR